MALRETVGFNDPYLITAKDDWNVLVKPSRERDMLFNFLLPQLFKEKGQQELF